MVRFASLMPIVLNELTVLRGHEDCVRSVCPSPNGSTIASGSDDGTVRVWQTGGGNELAVLQGHGGQRLERLLQPGWQVGLRVAQRTVQFASGTLAAEIN